MKKKKIVMYCIIIFFILLLIGMGYLIYININYNENEILEYTPAEEISDKQLRETVVSLYFLKKETNELGEERRGIDSKDLLENPYKFLVELLINGPENETLEKLIPEGIKIENAEIKNGIAYLYLSDNFLENSEIANKELIINSIEKTLQQLNEVEKIEIVNNI